MNFVTHWFRFCLLLTLLGTGISKAQEIEEWRMSLGLSSGFSSIDAGGATLTQGFGLQYVSAWELKLDRKMGQNIAFEMGLRFWQEGATLPLADSATNTGIRRPKTHLRTNYLGFTPGLQIRSSFSETWEFEASAMALLGALVTQGTWNTFPGQEGGRDNSNPQLFQDLYLGFALRGGMIWWPVEKWGLYFGPRLHYQLNRAFLTNLYDPTFYSFHLEAGLKVNF